MKRRPRGYWKTGEGRNKLISLSEIHTLTELKKLKGGAKDALYRHHKDLIPLFEKAIKAKGYWESGEGRKETIRLLDKCGNYTKFQEEHGGVNIAMQRYHRDLMNNPKYLINKPRGYYMGEIGKYRIVTLLNLLGSYEALKDYDQSAYTSLYNYHKDLKGLAQYCENRPKGFWDSKQGEEEITMLLEKHGSYLSLMENDSGAYDALHEKHTHLLGIPKYTSSRNFNDSKENLVYMLTFENGDLYFGRTCNPRSRFSKHKNNWEDNFTITILFRGLLGFEAHQLEGSMIDTYSKEGFWLRNISNNIFKKQAA